MPISHSIHLQLKPHHPNNFTSQIFTTKTKSNNSKISSPFKKFKIIQCYKTQPDYAFNAPHPKTLNSSTQNNEITINNVRRCLGSFLPRGSWWNLPRGEDANYDQEKRVSVVEAVKRMWGLLGDDGKCVFCVGVFALVVAAVSEISMPRILTASVFSAQGGDAVVFRRNIKILVILCITSGISSGLRSACFGVANSILVKRLRESLYSVLIFQDISFFDTETVGGLTSRLGADCLKLSHVFGNNIHLILRNALQGFGALINLLILSWPLALSSLVICCVLSSILLLYGQYQREAARLAQDFSANSNEVVQETLTLMRTVRAYGTEKEELKRYQHWLQKIAVTNMRESVAYGLWHMSFNVLYRSTQVFAVLLGGMSILTGQVSVEHLTKYILYCEWLIYGNWRLVDNLSSLMQSIGASEKVFQLADLLPSDQLLSKGVKLQKLKGSIHFANVSFYYPTRSMVPVLQDVNFSIEANEVIAIVGPSGSGKSTLVNILLRLYEPTDGQIYIDGTPLGELDIRWLRQKIGVVGQEPDLLHMDIKSNISYGFSGNVEDIERAAKKAHAHEFISSLPSGYDTYIDDQLLSGGQKQRIAIARAIFRDPAILIFDEATSALDPESEHYVKAILESFREAKRTVIVIAHRLSTIEVANRIVVMDNGQIIEMGDFTELVLKDGYFAHFVKTQTNSVYSA